jgi:hypothetical protein
MNSVNASTSFSPFQIRMGRSPRLIPPIVPSSLPPLDENAATEAAKILFSRISSDVNEAKDNLLQAKISQAFHANQLRGPEPTYQIGDCVMLATLHRHQEYKSHHDKRVAKFFPRFDGPYTITKTHPETSNYTLDMPNSEVYPVFHASELKPY